MKTQNDVTVEDVEGDGQITLSDATDTVLQRRAFGVLRDRQKYEGKQEDILNYDKKAPAMGDFLSVNGSICIFDIGFAAVILNMFLKFLAFFFYFAFTFKF